MRKRITAFLISLLLVPSCFAHSVTLSWNPSPSQATAPVQYNVYRSTAPGGENYGQPYRVGVAPNCSNVVNCTIEDDAVVAGGKYYYTVEACWAGAPQSCSVPSNEAPALIPVDKPTGLIIINSQ